MTETIAGIPHEEEHHDEDHENDDEDDEDHDDHEEEDEAYIETENMILSWENIFNFSDLYMTIIINIFKRIILGKKE